jgi:predicted  nucleic acid-binding Zn-ribbon protein
MKRLAYAFTAAHVGVPNQGNDRVQSLEENLASANIQIQTLQAKVQESQSQSRGSRDRDALEVLQSEVQRVTGQLVAKDGELQQLRVELGQLRTEMRTRTHETVLKPLQNIPDREYVSLMRPTCAG